MRHLRRVLHSAEEGHVVRLQDLPGVPQEAREGGHFAVPQNDEVGQDLRSAVAHLRQLRQSRRRQLQKFRLSRHLSESSCRGRGQPGASSPAAAG